MFSYKNYLLILFGSLAFSIGLQMVLPFPYGLAAALAVFIALPLLIRQKYKNQLQGGSTGGFGSGFFGNDAAKPMHVDVKYVCLTCNARFKGDACPRCGGKMKRADF